MRDEAKANEAADKAKKELVDKINGADAMVFQSEKNLKEYGDKIPADKKGAIENALGQLKEAHKSAKEAYDAGREVDTTALDRANDALNNAWHAASEDMAKAAQGAQGQPGAGFNPGAGQQGPQGGSNKQDDEVTDVDFEEIK